MKRPWYDLAFSGVDSYKIWSISKSQIARHTHNNAHYNAIIIVASWDFLNVQNEHIKEH